MAIFSSVVYTGAPDARSLSWREEDLTAPLWPCFSDDNRTHSLSLSSTEARPAWRSIPLEKQHLSTGLTQIWANSYIGGGTGSSPVEDASFLNTNSISFVSESDSHIPSSSAEAEEIISQFYEHSIALHDAVPSSQIIGSAVSDEMSSFQSNTSTNYSITQILSSPLLPPAVRRSTPMLPAPVHLSKLKEIPNAAYLKSINPQTVTVNLIVGLISISAPRVIKLRKTGHTMKLIEMTVGDETKAGFGINLWLPSSSLENVSEANHLQQAASHLRPRDIIMVRNLALSSFRGNVYGQSLRKEMTKIDLLYRVPVDKHDRKGMIRTRDLDESAVGDGYIGKVKSVKEWVMMFVSGGVSERNIAAPTSKAGKGKLNRFAHVLPPDTQE